MITVRIRGPKGLHQLQNLDPSTTVKEFQTKVADACGISLENQRLLSGFPPTEIDLADSDLSTISSRGIKNGDAITVQEKALANTQASAPAAEAISKESGGTKRKREAKTKKTAASGSSEDKSVIHTLHGKLFGTSSSSTSKKKQPASKRQKRNEPVAQDGTHKDQVARTLEEALIQAVDTENEAEDPLTKFLRSGTSEALRQREQETLATYRYQALLSGKYKFEMKQSYTLGTGAQPIFKVSFPADRGADHVEEHEALTRFQLYSIVKIVIDGSKQAPLQQQTASSSSSSSATVPPPSSNSQLSMELLKGYKMALVSPRVFWSMIFHFRYVDAGLKLMFPDEDWSFLDNRKREMSDRAKHNEKMKAIYEKLDKGEEITDEDLASAGLIEAARAQPAEQAAAAPEVPPATSAQEDKKDKIDESVQHAVAQDANQDAVE